MIKHLDSSKTRDTLTYSSHTHKEAWAGPRHRNREDLLVPTLQFWLCITRPGLKVHNDLDFLFPSCPLLSKGRTGAPQKPQTYASLHRFPELPPCLKSSTDPWQYLSSASYHTCLCVFNSSLANTLSLCPFIG
jgi:hypothetical protein